MGDGRVVLVVSGLQGGGAFGTQEAAGDFPHGPPGPASS